MSLLGHGFEELPKAFYRFPSNVHTETKQFV